MQSFVFVIFGSMLFMNSAFAADSLISSHTTHPVLEALPSASPQDSFQIAKTYYLPDYQQLIITEQTEDLYGDLLEKEKYGERSQCVNKNRAQEYERNGYECHYSKSTPSGSCYICTPKPCPLGYTAGLTECPKKTGYSVSHSRNGQSGEKICGKCDYKELPCASGYSTSYQSVSDCGTTGGAGWTFTSNGYSGEKKCGKCTAMSCLSGYSKTYSDVSKCGSKGSKGWSWEKSSQYAGNSVCGKCTKLSCNSPYASGITSCSPSDGYTLKQDSGRYNGDTVCGYCQANDCSGKTKQKDCNTSNGYTFTQTCKSGTTVYGSCTATPCPSGYSTAYQSVANCGSTGNSGWIFSSSGKSGGKICGKCTKRTCSSGVVKSACDTASGAKIWTAINGVYSGNDQCGKCEAGCPDGYSLEIKSADDCGLSGSKGWYTAIQSNCGKCYSKPCATGTTNQSCTGGQFWKPSTSNVTGEKIYSGDNECGYCTCGDDKMPEYECSGIWEGSGCYQGSTEYGTCTAKCQRDYCQQGLPMELTGLTPIGRGYDNCNEATCYLYSPDAVYSFFTNKKACYNQQSCTESQEGCFDACTQATSWIANTGTRGQYRAKMGCYNLCMKAYRKVQNQGYVLPGYCGVFVYDNTVRCNSDPTVPNGVCCTGDFNPTNVNTCYTPYASYMPPSVYFSCSGGAGYTACCEGGAPVE